jgi:hypothetical protein
MLLKIQDFWNVTPWRWGTLAVFMFRGKLSRYRHYDPSKRRGLRHGVTSQQAAIFSLTVIFHMPLVHCCVRCLESSWVWVGDGRIICVVSCTSQGKCGVRYCTRLGKMQFKTDTREKITPGKIENKPRFIQGNGALYWTKCSGEGWRESSYIFHLYIVLVSLFLCCLET